MGHTLNLAETCAQRDVREMLLCPAVAEKRGATVLERRSSDEVALPATKGLRAHMTTLSAITQPPGIFNAARSSTAISAPATLGGDRRSMQDHPDPLMQKADFSASLISFTCPSFPCFLSTKAASTKQEEVSDGMDFELARAARALEASMPIRKAVAESDEKLCARRVRWRGVRYV